MKKIRFDHRDIGFRCYKCMNHLATYEVELPVHEKFDIGTGDLMVYLCDDCANLSEDQLRIFFIG